MNRRRLFQVLLNGDGIPSDDLAGLRLPSIPTAVADYVTAKHVVGPVNKTVLTITDLPITMTDEAGVVAYGSAQLLDFVAGAIAIQGALANLTVEKDGAGINADFDGDFGVGTTAAGNNNALATTEQNIIPTTATPQASSGATTAKGLSTATEQAVIDGTSSAADLFLNFLIDDGDQDGGGTLNVSGTITLLWSDLGDY